jgi:TonB family protein
MKNKMMIAFALLAGLSLLSYAQEAKRPMKTKTTPVFPALARKMNVAGAVKVECVVLPNGSVKAAKALGGHPLLIEAAISAAKASKFEPASEETKELVTYNFNSSSN